MSSDAQRTSPGGAGHPLPVAPASGMFVRNATGLVREIGLLRAFIINLAVLNPGGGLVTFAVALALFPAANFTWPIVIGAVLVLFLALSYAQLVSSMPRTGGDYVFVSRLINPGVGAMSGGGLVVGFMLVGGVNLGILTQQYLPFGFQALGSAFNSAGLTNFAGTVSGKNASFLVAAIVVVLLMACALFSNHLLNRVMFWCVVTATVGFVVMVIQFFMHSSADFASAFNAYSKHPGAYQSLISTAHHLGVSSVVTVGASAAVLPFVVLNYWGFTWSVYPSGEVKRPLRTTVWSTLLALLAGLLMYLIGWVAIEHTAGLSFLRSANWLATNSPTAYSHITSAPTTIIFYALLVTTDPVSKVIMGIAFPLSIIGIVAAYILVLSRILFALSFDRLLPSAMARVTPRRHVPIVAYIVTAIGFLAFVALATYTSFLTVFSDQTIIGSIGFTLVSLAAAVLPYVKPELYASSPRAFQGKWLGLPPITVIGGISAIINIWLTYVIISKPQIIGGGFSASEIAGLLVVFFWGLLAFIVVSIWTRHRGIGFGLASRELPPE